MAYCRRCLEIVCERGSSRVGLCPTCRTNFTISEKGVVTNDIQQGTCAVCRQLRPIVTRGMCGACATGQAFDLNYECERCNRIQRIPHPMWKYQESPEEFGNVTWACHSGHCPGAYTHWRVVTEEAQRIPDDHVPASWGRREQWLEGIREQRRRELGEGAAAAAEHAANQVHEHND